MKLKILFLFFISLQVVFGYSGNNEKLLNKYVKDLDNLNPSQLDIMFKSYKYGLEYGLEYILPAIAWKESNFGEFMLNLSDGEYGSFGPYHIRLDYSIKRNNITSKWLRDRHAEKLINDLEYSAREAIYLVNYWYENLKTKYKKQNIDREMFSAYNGGFNYNNSLAISYADDALLRVKALQLFFRKYSLDNRTLSSKSHKLAVNKD